VIQNGRGQHRDLLRADRGSSEEVGPSYRRSASMPVGPRLTPPRLDADRNRPTDQPDMAIGANSTALRQSCLFTECSTSALDRFFNGITHRLPALPKQVLSSRRNLMRMSAFGATCRPSGPGEGPESTHCRHSARLVLRLASGWLAPFHGQSEPALNPEERTRYGAALRPLCAASPAISCAHSSGAEARRPISRPCQCDINTGTVI
jgi:hypothetical protein